MCFITARRSTGHHQYGWRSIYRSHSTTPTATAAGTELTVERDALQSALVVLDDEYLEMYSTPSFWYLCLDIAATYDATPARSDLAFRSDGETHRPRGIDELLSVYPGFGSESVAHYDADE